jgi:hypothetical protein
MPISAAYRRSSARAVHRAEYVTGGQSDRRCPGIHRNFHPPRHWRGTNASVLADEVNNAPAAVALLHVRERERRDLRSPQAAAKEDSQDRAIA